MDITKAIENKMLDLRISQAEMSRRLGISPQGWKGKIADPKWSTIEQVCKAMGIEPKDLFVNDAQQPSGSIICPYCGQGFMVAAIKKED